MKAFSTIFLQLALISSLIISLSCCRKNAPQRDSDDQQPVQHTITRLASPKPNTILKSGDSVKIALSSQGDSLVIDSVAVTTVNGLRITAMGNPQSLYWQSAGKRMGQTTLRVLVYFNDSLHESHNVNIVILSDRIPENFSYRIIGKYPHDNTAYTQGLIYDNGQLYESTGLEGKSTVRLINIGTGHPEKTVNLDQQYFGEGIALFNDQIYQITYKSQVGFVYDKNSLSQIRSFDYQIREGWGLTTDGKSLIMSDGSAQLFFIEPEYFTQVDKVEVLDNKGLVDSLNELEYADGKILANVYGQTFIVIIDPSSGKVTGKIELRNLVPKGFEGDYGKVLNGIAFNPATGNLFITGKNWPYLYEIKLIPAL